ncbi:MAG: FAD-dependent oxidoreductase [Myxococcaceae bacterium]|nr:FAD-dependent oxidoreductase [Myxococcaceae bacterium]
MARDSRRLQCCIAGGGPAGMMLGLLLARAGVEVLVLEKHADFLRDFRGDTLHPSSLEVLHELGLLEEFLELPHQKAFQMRVRFEGQEVVVADFGRLPTRCKYIAFIPQWDFLNFLAAKAAAYPNFALRMRTEVTGLLEEGDRVVGVRARGEEGELELRADLVVAADGRQSVLRERAGLSVEELGAPMDVLWFRLPRRPGDPVGPMAEFFPGRILVMLNRTTYWQCGFLIRKGSLEEVKARGLEAFRAELARAVPLITDRLDDLRSWEDVRLLTVRVDRLTQWYRAGLLCIGDAAHAMSPVGGIGINLAIQDAVAAANLLAEPLRSGTLTTEHLRQVQARRDRPTRMTQRVQVFFQNRVLGPVLGGQISPRLPRVLRMMARLPFLRRAPARFVGMGFRPEHVHTPAVTARSSELASTASPTSS